MQLVVVLEQERPVGSIEFGCRFGGWNDFRRSFFGLSLFAAAAHFEFLLYGNDNENGIATLDWNLELELDGMHELKDSM